MFKVNYLNGVYIVGDDDQLSLLFLNQRSDIVDTLAEDERPLGGFVGLASSTDLGTFTQPLLLGLLALRAVLVEQLKQLCGCWNTRISYKLVNSRAWSSHAKPSLPSTSQS